MRPLEISQPGDAYEREADRVAERVMRMPAGPVASSRPAGPTAPSATAPAIVHDVVRSAGRPLDAVTRAFMEPRFRTSFSGVRVHTDERAAESARAVDAAAYTVGNAIVFDRGRYTPGTPEGRRLLAHELTHVVQQGEPGARRSVQRQLYPPVPIVGPIPLPPQPLEVNAVDARQETSIEWYKPWRYTGPITNFFRGDVTMTSISTMVANVLTFLGSRRMHRLNVMDHGNQNGVEIGGDWLQSAADVASHVPTLRRLRPAFASGAVVHMQNCRSGQNQSLICALAAAFGVPVYAGTGLHNPLLGFNFGDYVRCNAAGTFNPNAGRPSTPRPAPMPEMA